MSLCPGTDIDILQRDTETGSGEAAMAKLQTFPQLADKEVFTIGHQSDAVVFVQSGPVGKAIHTTCTQ